MGDTGFEPAKRPYDGIQAPAGNALPKNENGVEVRKACENSEVRACCTGVAQNPAELVLSAPWERVREALAEGFGMILAETAA
jgi:hypothetical protein